MTIEPLAAEGVRLYQPRDSDAVLAFRREMYGPASAHADPAVFRWLYELPGPNGMPSPLWVYRTNGRILGHVAGRQVRLKAGGVEVDASWLTEFVTAPTARKRGVGATLAAELSADRPVALALEVSDAARTILQRQGWLDLGAPPLYVRPFDVAALVRDRGRPARAAIRSAGALLYRGFDRAVRALTTASRVTFARVDRFDSRVDRLWTEVAPSYPVAVRRDAAYLNWRFVEFPRAGFYDVHYVLRGDRLVGWTVTRRSVRHGRASGELVDFFCAPRTTRTLLAHVLHLMRGAEVSALYCLHLNPRARLAFLLLGFLPRPSGWTFMLRATSDIARDLPLLGDRRQWFLTAGDSNVDRPRDGTVYVDASGDRAQG